jgi:hypothetical protein
MTTRQCSNSPRAAKLTAIGFLVLLSTAAHAGAKIPTWLRDASTIQLSTYSAEIDAVQLLEQETVTVTANGEVVSFHREAYKILRPRGKELGEVEVTYRPQTKINFIRGWSITPEGALYETTDKDAVDTNWRGGSDYYSDLHTRIIKIPAVAVGTIIGFEYEKAGRPYVYQNVWSFQSFYPVLKSRFTLRLPPGWEYKDQWTNHTSVVPFRSGNELTWELQNVPPIEDEDDMPHPSSIAGRMAVNYYPGNATGFRSVATWNAMGLWYASLAADRLSSSPDIKSRVAALTAGVPDQLGKIRALSAFAQREIRYVAIEIGIGGYQPHPAPEVFKNRFGDCKDKATLFNTMLKEIGVDAYYIVINTTRGVVREEVPSVGSFNHVISAIKLPAGVSTEGLEPTIDHPKLGKLLIFDPTAEMVPLGQLPYYLQANKGLLVTPDGGELISIPLLKPETNRLTRIANLEITADGTLVGDVRETRWGWYAAEARHHLLTAEQGNRAQLVQSLLSSYIGKLKLQKAAVSNLDSFDNELVLLYRFEAPGYAKVAGNLLLIRPRVLGENAFDRFERTRRYPVDFGYSAQRSDDFSIKLPAGYQLDELPDPVSIGNDFVEYDSKVQLSGNLLTYKRNYRIKDVLIPTDRFEEMKMFYRQVAADERNSAVLRKEAR